MKRSPLRTVLVIDDQDAVRRLIGRTLTRLGFRVLEANGGTEALALFKASVDPIHLAIIDMVMPQMGGLDVAAELQRLDPGLRVLYISGAVESIAIESVQHRSPEQVLQKPFTERRLMEKVSGILGALGK